MSNPRCLIQEIEEYKVSKIHEYEKYIYKNIQALTWHNTSKSTKSHHHKKYILKLSSFQFQRISNNPVKFRLVRFKTKKVACTPPRQTIPTFFKGRVATLGRSHIKLSPTESQEYLWYWTVNPNKSFSASYMKNTIRWVTDAQEINSKPSIPNKPIYYALSTDIYIKHKVTSFHISSKTPGHFISKKPLLSKPSNPISNVWNRIMYNEKRQPIWQI